MSETKTYIFSFIPEEITFQIYKQYFVLNVIPEIKKYTPSCIWETPSDSLIHICLDNGCFQIGDNVYTGLEDLFETEILDINGNCVGISDNSEIYNGKCGNCIHYGFPCINCACYCSKKIGIFCLWNIENKIKEPINIEEYTVINRILKSKI
jgi:hypothetical protein